jgi:hypothetical protein
MIERPRTVRMILLDLYLTRRQLFQRLPIQRDGGITSSTSPLLSHLKTNLMQIEKEPEQTEQTELRSGLSFKKRHFVIVVVILLLGGGLWFGGRYAVYQRPPDDALAQKVASLFPFSAIRVGDITISMNEYLTEYQAFKQSFEQQEEASSFDDSQLQDMILQTLVNKAVIARLAREHGVKTDTEKVQELYSQTIKEQESEEAFALELRETFGWSVETFKKRVIESIVLSTQMETFVRRDEEIQRERAETAMSAYERLQSGEVFEDVAKQVNATFRLDQSDIGFFDQSALPEDLQENLESVDEGSYGEILDNDELFGIFYVAERIPAGEDTRLHLFAVTVPKQTLQEIVQKFVDDADIKRYI